MAAAPRVSPKLHSFLVKTHKPNSSPDPEKKILLKIQNVLAFLLRASFCSGKGQCRWKREKEEREEEIEIIREKERERERENKEMYGMAAIENQAVTANPNKKNCGVEGIIGR